MTLDSPKIRYGIIGTGAMASFFASRLAAFGDVTLIGSWRAQIDAVNAGGIQVVELDGSQTQISVNATADAASTFPVDVALILTKSYQSEISAERVAACLAPNGIAITLQNGLGNLAPLINAVGQSRASAGTTSLGATLLHPGNVRHAGAGKTWLSQPAEPHPGITTLAQHLQSAGLEIGLTDNLPSLLWGKVAINAGINPLTALLGVQNGFLAHNRQARSLMQAAALEVARVADALQISLPYNDVVSEVVHVAEATAENSSSMLQDIRRDAPTEIDAICGQIVRIGKEVGIPTPLNKLLFEMMISAETETNRQNDQHTNQEIILARLARTITR